MNYAEEIEHNEEFNEKFNFEVKPITSSDGKVGCVEKQDPEPGTKVPKGRTIKLYVVTSSDGQTLPDLKGMNYQEAKNQLEDMGFGHLPVCMAKNQYSLSDDATKLGRPTGFDINIREVYVSAGAGFVVVLTGAIMTMPGLPKKPAADGIDVDDNGVITGLF